LQTKRRGECAREFAGDVDGEAASAARGKRDRWGSASRRNVGASRTGREIDKCRRVAVDAGRWALRGRRARKWIGRRRRGNRTRGRRRRLWQRSVRVCDRGGAEATSEHGGKHQEAGRGNARRFDQRLRFLRRLFGHARLLSRGFVLVDDAARGSFVKRR